MISDKIDALDLIICVLRDHEKALDDSIYRLEGIEGEKPMRSTSDNLLLTAKEMLYMFREVMGYDIRIRVNISKNSYLEVDVSKKKRKKVRRDESLKDDDSLEVCPVIIT